MIIQLHRLANERPNTLIDSSPALLHPQRTGNALISTPDLSEEEAELDGELLSKRSVMCGALTDNALQLLAIPSSIA